jgi:5-methyltetrahydrofolate--homocysteine methyltransferase
MRGPGALSPRRRRIRMEQLKEMVRNGKSNDAAASVQKLLDEGKEPEAIMKNALIAAMDEIGDLFQKGEAYLPEMLVAAKAMKKCMEIIKPRIVKSGMKPIGKVIVGTVKGDLHDIGKNLVVMALEGAGFDVIDLGIDVAPDKFVAAVREHKPQVVGLSALLTTTMLTMKDTVEAIKSAGLRDKVKIMIGGAPVKQQFADDIGADFFGPDSTSGKNYARIVVSGEA